MEAKYTCLYKDWLARAITIIVPGTNGTFLKSGFDNVNDPNIDTQKLYDMLINVYKYYEIGEDDDEHLVMLTFMLDTYKEYAPYYSELIKNYTKEYDYAKNNKRVVKRKDELNIAGDSQLKNKSDGKNTEYVLPNKVTDENYESTPSGITKDVNNYEQNKEYNNNTSRDSETETEFNNEFIDLKNKYLNQIRNVYREFTMKFKECFYQIY